jgi:hypothetical protein
MIVWVKFDSISQTYHYKQPTKTYYISPRSCFIVFQDSLDLIIKIQSIEFPSTSNTVRYGLNQIYSSSSTNDPDFHTKTSPPHYWCHNNSISWKFHQIIPFIRFVCRKPILDKSLSSQIIGKQVRLINKWFQIALSSSVITSQFLHCYWYWFLKLVCGLASWVPNGWKSAWFAELLCLKSWGRYIFHFSNFSNWTFYCPISLHDLYTRKALWWRCCSWKHLSRFHGH